MNKAQEALVLLDSLESKSVFEAEKKIKYVVKKDGEEKGKFDSHNDAFVHVQKSQGQSVDYALKSGGWSIDAVEEAGGDRKVTEFEFEDIGVEHADYFQGRGTYGTDWNDVFVGIGGSAREAAEDAVDLATQAGSIEDVEKLIDAEIEKMSSEEDVPEDSEDQYHYVALYVKTSSKGEEAMGEETIYMVDPDDYADLAQDFQNFNASARRVYPSETATQGMRSKFGSLRDEMIKLLGRLKQIVSSMGDTEENDEGLGEKKLTYKQRQKLPSSAFVYPGERKYPIHDFNHARNALSRVGSSGTPAEKKRVQAAVYKKYPELKPKK